MPQNIITVGVYKDTKYELVNFFPVFFQKSFFYYNYLAHFSLTRLSDLHAPE